MDNGSIPQTTRDHAVFKFPKLTAEEEDRVRTLCSMLAMTSTGLMGAAERIMDRALDGERISMAEAIRHMAANMSEGALCYTWATCNMAYKQLNAQPAVQEFIARSAQTEQEHQAEREKGGCEA